MTSSLEKKYEKSKSADFGKMYTKIKKNVSPL